MAVTAKVESHNVTLTCAMNLSHRIGAADMAQHYINTHGASDTAPTTSREWVQEGGGRGDEPMWGRRDNYQCPVCLRHGKSLYFRNLRTAEEDTAGDSLQFHLTDFHGAS